MTAPDGRRIVAVVVTYNRLDLLQRLLARLDQIDLVDEIVVVDNASTDGTTQWLRGLEASSARTSAIVKATNSGGAGGFHDGVAWAVGHGADLVWLMDDDGLPDPDCLTRLLDHDDLDFWGPVVVDQDAPDRLVFPIRLPGGARTVRQMPDVRAAAGGASGGGLIRDVVIPFNGVLVTRDLVDRIGLPRAEFFIWGDDVEYLWRAQEADARTATVVDAVVRHPSVGALGTPMMFGRTTYNHSPSDLKHYCMARNNLANLRRYHGWAYVLAFVAKTAWFYTVTRPSPARLLLSARAMTAGLLGRWGGERRYL